MSGSFPVTVACPGVCEVRCTFPPAAHQALCCPMLAGLSLDLSLGLPPLFLLRVVLPGRGRGRLSSWGHVHVASRPWNLTFSGVNRSLHFAKLYVLATRLTFRASHTWPWAPHWEPRPETVGGTQGPVVRPHPHTSPGPWHRPQGPCAWTLSPLVGAPSLSPHLVWMGAPRGFRTAAWGPTASLTPGLQAAGTFVQHCTAHVSPSREGSATHLVPRVSPWPGRSSGGLQIKEKGQPGLASGVTPEVVRVPHSPGIRRSSTAGGRRKDRGLVRKWGSAKGPGYPPAPQYRGPKGRRGW